jgi:diguanylate cyclase (GGDEF)-like protein/PAS domain S-box-containing protein
LLDERAAESRYRALVEQIPAMTYIAAVEVGVTTYVSPQIEPLLGYTQEEWLADPQQWARTLHPDDRTQALDFMANVRATGGPGALEYRLRARDARIVWVRDEAALLYDEEGRPTAMQGVVTDVTARREAEATLREREERFRLVARATNDAIWDWDLTTNALWWSKAIQDILGYAPEEIGHAIEWWEEHIHPAERDGTLTTIYAAIAGEAEHWSSEYRLRRADGSYAQVFDRGFILRDEGGRAVRMLGSVQDVTAQRAAEAETRRQARELALLDRVRTALARELELSAILDTLVNEIAVAFETVSVGVLLLEGDRLLGRAHVEKANHPLSLHVSEGLTGRCARTGTPLLIPDVQQEPAFIGDPGQQGSEICVPLLVEGRVIGVLNVERETEPPLDTNDLTLLVALGEQASIAIGRARLHTALAASEARHRAVVDTALDAIITMSEAETIESFNQGAERIFGYTAAQVIGQPLTLLLHAPLSQFFGGGIAQRLVTGFTHLGGRPLEMIGKRKDGATFPAEVVLAQVRIAGEQFITGIVRDISERRAYEERLQHQAHHDPLTGLPNRALFLDRLNQALNRARRDGQQRAVLFIDLDRFKDVNDSWGHDAGDRLLVGVTARLRACLRDEDTLARQGGDEFTILLEAVADAGEAARVADRLATALDRPFPIEGQEHRITASIGIVMTQGVHLRAEDLLRDADIAMYRAKEAGKARYAIFDPAMQSGLLERLALERELRQALDTDRFVLHYQPIVDLATRAVVKVEALVRWPHPQRGFIPPTTFIPIAEESGLIRPLGRWVLREACRQARLWEQAGLPVAVAVNLTAHEFQGATLIEEVTSALAATGLTPEHLLLEITESVAMRDVAATTATLATLRGHGVRVAIDDFGTGYSSLAYLKRLPVDTLKIDRAFIDGLGDDPEDTAIVEAIITLAHTLGLQVVAEGVETPAQAAQLRTLGCESAQGYLFARPLPASDLRALLALERLTTDNLATVVTIGDD